MPNKKKPRRNSGNKKIMGAIRIVKLKNGEFFIAGISFKGKVAIIESPMNIQMLPMMDENGQYMAIGYKAWMQFSKSDCYRIPKSQILMVSVPQHEILSGYKSALKESADDILEIDEQLSDINQIKNMIRDKLLDKIRKELPNNTKEGKTQKNTEDDDLPKEKPPLDDKGFDPNADQPRDHPWKI